MIIIMLILLVLLFIVLRGPRPPHFERVRRRSGSTRESSFFFQGLSLRPNNYRMRGRFPNMF